ncbi:MAG TPA: NACHT domain-containing protein [Pseudonocardiaceae bacterium]|jgi:hypothetical protein|nr:NACHT domain-containing protein [Pseudonocardiaceae bacterium]
MAGSSNNWTARVGFVLAILGPPAVATGVWRAFVESHPLVSVGLLLAYEAVLALLRFSGEIAGDLRQRWRQRLVDNIDAALRRQLSHFGARYREAMLNSLRIVDLKGLETSGIYTPELDEVFVDVTLAFRAPNQVPTDLLADLPDDVTDRRSINNFLDLPKPGVLAVVGAPGSGKTTLLRHTARDVCRGRHGRRRTVPILLYLRDHAPTISANFNLNLPELLARSLVPLGVNPPDGWFDRQLRRGNCVVLLDGLDEVARSDQRASVADWVDRQVARYPKNDYVITSRPTGYRQTQVYSATVLQACAFTDQQVSKFIHGWYFAIEKHTTKATGDELKRRAAMAADDLLGRLNNAPALYELTVNPLLLTMIVNVHRYRGVLPGSRARLYHEICQVMLGLRQEAKKLTMDMDGDRKEVLLRGLAYAMMRAKTRDMSKADLLAELKPALRRMSRDLTAESFLADIASNGLLLERENGLYSFAHLTFQEYLAAMHIRDKSLVRVLTEAVNDDWWRETTLLYTAHTDADPIVHACLKSASVTAISLAFDCTEYETELAPELRDYLDDLLKLVFAPDTNPELRRLMAGVLVTRHLRRRVRTSNGGGVCVAPITTGIYWLFQQDNQDRQLDRPIQLKATMDEPISGVNNRDIGAFVQWINEVSGSGLVYRLPTGTEMQDPAVRRMLNTRSSAAQGASVWLADVDDDRRHTLWRAAGVEHPHQVNGKTLAHHIRQDLERSPGSLARLLLIYSIVANRLLYVGLDRILGLVQKGGQSRVPQLDLTLESASAKKNLLRDAIAANKDLHKRVLPMIELDQALDVDRALEFASAFDIDLSQRYKVSGMLTFLNAVNTSRAANNVAQLSRINAVNRTQAIDRILAFDLAGSLKLREVFDVASGTNLNESLSVDAYAGLNQALGTALSFALAASFYSGDGTGLYLGRKPDLSTWRNRFLDKLLDRFDVADQNYTISPESLADLVDNTCNALLELIDRTENSWAYQVTEKLRAVALPLFNREETITGELASALRLGASCLAVEADIRKAPDFGDDFRKIAAGITFLERLTTGQFVPTDTIMLATS